MIKISFKRALSNLYRCRVLHVEDCGWGYPFFPPAEDGAAFMEICPEGWNNMKFFRKDNELVSIDDELMLLKDSRGIVRKFTLLEVIKIEKKR